MDLNKNHIQTLGDYNSPGRRMQGRGTSWHWQSLGEMKRTEKEAPKKLKVLTHKTVISPVLLYGAETRQLSGYLVGRFSVCQN